MPVPRRFDRRPPDRDPTRINERIRVPKVRLIGADGEQVGVVDTDEARRIAREADLDLVEVAPDSRPPVCRLLDYSKYKYEQEQKAKQARKHQQQVNVREIKLRPKIADHDYETKKGHVERFLNKKDKVKVTIMFRGREQAHPERGRALLDRLYEDLGDLATSSRRPSRRAATCTWSSLPARSPEHRLAPRADASARATLPARVAASGSGARRRPLLQYPRPHAEDEDPFRRQEALQEDRPRASSAAAARTRATSSRRSRRSASARWRGPVAIAPADTPRVNKLLAGRKK